MSKFITIIITIVLAISLTACGGNTPTPAQSASEPSSSAVSVAEQTSSVEPESSEPETSEASSETESSSESASSSEPAASAAESSTTSTSSTSNVPAKPTSFLSSLTDEQFAELLYGMTGSVKDQVVEYIWELSLEMFEESEAYENGKRDSLQFPDLYDNTLTVIGRDEVPQEIINRISAYSTPECVEYITDELDYRGYTYVWRLWETGDSEFFEILTDKLAGLEQ